MPLSLCCRYMQLYHAISLWNIKTGFQHLFCPCVLDVGNIIDSDLPGKITFIQPANDGRQVLLVDIAEAYGDMGHPLIGMVVFLSAGGCGRDFLPEGFMQLCEFKASYNGNVDDGSGSGENAQSAGSYLEGRNV